MDNKLADFLAERRDTQRKRTAEYLFERFKKAKGCAPASVAELYAFLIEERIEKGSDHDHFQISDCC
jgi:hypothetical protein